MSKENIEKIKKENKDLRKLVETLEDMVRKFWRKMNKIYIPMYGDFTSIKHFGYFSNEFESFKCLLYNWKQELDFIRKGIELEKKEGNERSVKRLKERLLREIKKLGKNYKIKEYKIKDKFEREKSE